MLDGDFHFLILIGTQKGLSKVREKCWPGNDIIARPTLKL